MKYAVCLFILLSFVIYRTSALRHELIFDYLDFPLGKNDKLFDYGTVRVKKFNRTTYTVVGEMEVLRPFHDQLLWHLSIDVMQGNEYRQYMSRKGDKICTASIKYRGMFTDALDHTSLTSEYECPIPPGKYWIKDLAMQNIVLLAVPPQGNKFRINYTFFDGEELISACAFYVTLNVVSLY